MQLTVFWHGPSSGVCLCMYRSTHVHKLLISNIGNLPFPGANCTVDYCHNVFVALPTVLLMSVYRSSILGLPREQKGYPIGCITLSMLPVNAEIFIRD